MMLLAVFSPAIHYNLFDFFLRSIIVIARRNDVAIHFIFYNKKYFHFYRVYFTEDRSSYDIHHPFNSPAGGGGKTQIATDIHTLPEFYRRFADVAVAIPLWRGRGRSLNSIAVMLQPTILSFIPLVETKGKELQNAFFN
ncbi:hypothetical protein [Pedobacter agri]|uniref:hypothetical protein n=1 Tax=Pedobacter agri TaxID=454586 RepID=UPI00292FDC0D|nr:hypothetical protein [Pedobacter agri]